MLPVVFGFISDWLFALSAALAVLLLFVVYRMLTKWGHGGVDSLKRVVAPWMLVQVLLLSMYFLRVIPPVPLSVQFMGIYHSVDKDGRNFKMAHAPTG